MSNVSDYGSESISTDGDTSSGGMEDMRDRGAPSILAAAQAAASARQAAQHYLDPFDRFQHYLPSMVPLRYGTPPVVVTQVRGVSMRDASPVDQGSGPGPKSSRKITTKVVGNDPQLSAKGFSRSDKGKGKARASPVISVRDGTRLARPPFAAAMFPSQGLRSAASAPSLQMFDDDDDLYGDVPDKLAPSLDVALGLGRAPSPYLRPASRPSSMAYWYPEAPYTNTDPRFPHVPMPSPFAQPLPFEHPTPAPPVQSAPFIPGTDATSILQRAEQIMHHVFEAIPPDAGDQQIVVVLSELRDCIQALKAINAIPREPVGVQPKPTPGLVMDRAERMLTELASKHQAKGIRERVRVKIPKIQEVIRQAKEEVTGLRRYYDQGVADQTARINDLGRQMRLKDEFIQNRDFDLAKSHRIIRAQGHELAKARVQLGAARMQVVEQGQGQGQGQGGQQGAKRKFLAITVPEYTAQGINHKILLTPKQGLKIEETTEQEVEGEIGEDGTLKIVMFLKADLG